MVVEAESAVAGLAACLVAAQKPQWRDALGLNEQSRILVLGSEGATAQSNIINWFLARNTFL